MGLSLREPLAHAVQAQLVLRVQLAQPAQQEQMALTASPDLLAPPAQLEPLAHAVQAQLEPLVLRALQALPAQQGQMVLTAQLAQLEPRV